MNPFPMVDPIPLPAPVWLFKALHLLTLSLHFTAMQMFLGGLLVAAVLSACSGSSVLRKGAAAALAHRLPILMTFVINLGVPPLLFAQVLYGPALYTSSQLIGVYWFSVIFMLMGCYWLLYKFAEGVDKGRNVWWMAAFAGVLALSISKIYSINMTLMLRPEVWQGMYAASPLGALLPPHDPTLIPRWLFMLSGAGWVSGFWMIWIAGRRTTALALGSYLAGLGGSLALGAILCQGALFSWVLKAQPTVVQEGINMSVWLKGAQIAWCSGAALVFIFALWVAVKKTCSYVAGYISMLLTVVTLSSWVILRDGIRDITLESKGFDVWQQAVVTNWGVVGWFVVILVLGLVALGWLIYVMMQAKPVSEGGMS
ncbi:MAG: hypothetical protein HQL21_02350 [Candidatus Omnitrophica bacterium]|nr:hypothetical protein [Candidatus Omnitrophota bacterium]